MRNLIKPALEHLKDPRYFQIFYLSLFLSYGIFELGWNANIPGFIAVILVSLLTQMVFSFFLTKNYASWKSALITALGLCLLLKSNQWEILALGGFLAIASKFVFKVKGKHLFNPANFGIIVTILITGEAWISPGQWGSSPVLLYFIGAAALMILFKVGRIDTSLIFLVTLFVLDIIYSQIYLGWEWSVFAHKATNGTLLLYAFFMITDPVTTPNHIKGRVIWSVLLGIISFVLMSQFYIHTAPIWVLFFLAPLTAFMDRKYQFERFQWLNLSVVGRGPIIEKKNQLNNSNTIKLKQEI